MILGLGRMALSLGYVYEDHNFQDEAIQAWRGVPQEWDTLSKLTLTNRPIVVASLRLSTWLTAAPWLPHLENFALHGLVCALCALVAVRLGISGYWAFLTMLILPLNVEGWAYVSSRSELLGVTGVLLGVCGLRAPVWTLSSLMLVGAGIALAALTNPAMASAALILFPLVVWVDRADDWRERVTVPLMVLVAGVGFYGAHLGRTPELELATVGWGAYVLHQLGATMRLAGLVVWPSSLALDHQFATATLTIPLLALGTWIAAAVTLRRRVPAIGYLLIWWVGAFGFRLVVPQINYLTEHHAYLPACGVAWSVGALLRDV